MAKVAYVPGEQKPDVMGGDVIFTQTPGSSSGDSGYNPTPDNPQGREPTQLTVNPPVVPEIITGLGQSGARIPRPPAGSTTIDPNQVGQGVIDYYAEQNALVSAEQVDVGALSSQYEGLISRLQNSYALAETEEEKQRLRYMLADIEAQYDAAKESISVTYQAERELLARRIEEEKLYAQDFAERGGQVFSNLADESEARLAGISAQRQQDWRGLGIEAPDQVSNEWTQTIRALGPIQTSYLLEAGNNRVASMNRSLDSMVMQEMAQQADLERLKARTTSEGQYRYLQEVGDRINQERVAMREDFTRIMMTKIAATQSALEFNASMRDRAASRMQQEPDPAARYDAFREYARAEGAMLVDPEQFERQFMAASRGEAPDDAIWYDFLLAGRNASRSEFNVASRTFTQFAAEVLGNGFDPSSPQTYSGGAQFGRVLSEQYSILKNDMDSAYAVYNEYETLLREIEGR